MNVQQRVAEYVHGSGIKNSFIAEKTGIHKDVVSRILHNSREMRVDEFELFCKALKKSPSDFIHIDD